MYTPDYVSPATFTISDTTPVGDDDDDDDGDDHEMFLWYG